MKPDQWMIIDRPLTPELLRTVRRLPRGSGILVVTELSAHDRRRLRRLAGPRALALADEASGSAARVHNLRELRRALLARTPLILLSPLYPTRSHPDWRPVLRMRAACFARLAGRRLVALGGMNGRRYAKIAPFGFIGWAGISAWSRR